MPGNASFGGLLLVSSELHEPLTCVAANPAVAGAPVAPRGPRLVPGWMLESRDGIHLLLHPDHPAWCAVNGFGLEMARLADGSRSVDELCAETSTRFAVGYEEVRKPVERFLDQLGRAGLLLGAEAASRESRPAPRVRVDHLNLHVAKGCNLRCRHCAVIDGYARRQQLGKAQLLRVIDQFAEIDGASVALSGGEPLVRRDLPEILDYAAGRAHVILTTNGTLITGEIAAQLARLGATVEISIDGSCAEIHDRLRGKGAFAAALRGIGHLAAAGIARRNTFTTTITRTNLDDLEGIIALAERVGAGFVRFSPVQPVARAERSWDEVGPTAAELRQAYRFLYLELGQRTVEISGGFPGFVLDFAKGEQWCSLGRTLALDPEGNIYPCQLFQHPNYLVGSIREMSLREATESPELLGTIRDAASRRSVVEDCKSCHWRNFCQGSCAASVRWQKGTLWATDELCDARRELYRDVVFGIAEGRRRSLATPRTEVSVRARGPRTVANVAVEEHDGATILLHPERATYLVTNEAGLRAYRLADGTRTTAGILASLSEELGIPVAELEAPMQSFFREVMLSGFLARPDADQRPVDRAACAVPVRIRILFIHLTNVCNLSCTHCYRASGPSRSEDDAELSTKRICELVDELVELGGHKITFTGGEPLARRDCLEILRYAGARVRLTLLTNAMLIDERTARALAELPISVQVSLDGSTAEVHDAIRGPGGFERTLRGIAHLRAAGLGSKTNISASMLRGNLHDLLNLIPLVEQLELPELRFMPLHELGRAQDNWSRIAPIHDEYLAFYRKLYFEGYASHPRIRIHTGFSGLVFPRSRNDPGHSWCPIGQMVALKPNGDAYACALMMQDEDYIGNVRGRSLGELQESYVLKKAADEVARRRQVIAKCRACNWRHFCQGSCPGLTRIKANSVWATDRFCDLRREIFRTRVTTRNVSGRSEAMTALRRRWLAALRFPLTDVIAPGTERVT